MAYFLGELTYSHSIYKKNDGTASGNRDARTEHRAPGGPQKTASHSSGREEVFVVQPIPGSAWYGRRTILRVDDVNWLVGLDMGERQIRETGTERHVRTAGISVGNPRFQDAPQMRFRQGNQPIETLATNGFDDSFADRIGLRTAGR